MINLFPVDGIHDDASDDQPIDNGAAEAVSLNGMRKATAKVKAPKAKAPKGFKADGLGVLRAIGKGDFDAPAKASKVKAPKAEKPAKAKKPAPEPIAQASQPQADPIDTFFAEYIGADIRDDSYIIGLLKRVYEAGKAAPRIRAPRAGGPTKRELAADLLRRPEGCTAGEILELTGWPAVSVPAVAKASGLTLRKEKEGRLTVYFGTPA